MKKKLSFLMPLLVLGALWISRAGAGGPEPAAVPAAEPGEERSGGAATVFVDSRNAFGQALGNMDPSRWFPMRDGKAVFLRKWVEARGDGKAGGGLGPLFNAVSCSACHFKDGSGPPPEEGTVDPLLFRLSVPGKDGASLPEPHYGWQLQEHSVAGVPAEGKVIVSWQETAGRYPDGELYTLRAPVFRFEELAYGPLDPRVQISARIPPRLLGLGLLEAIPDAAILALADPSDADGDGISGRPNSVPDLRTGGTALGRFGWKAGQPTLEQQNATALHEDLGVTSDLLPAVPCAPGQAPCLAVSHGGPPEIAAYELARITLYTRLLAVPARRDWQAPEVLRGKALFRQIGCESCHHGRFETAANARLPELSGQTIHPYTDLLLHDMGPGLADGRPEHAADGAEWRTPPLWGLGLLKVVSREIRLLHDGRARTAEEAILWHGGEGEASREAFKKLPKNDRNALLRFLDSL